MTIERTIPVDARREVDREDSSEVFLAFLTISHSALSDDIRVVSDSVDYILGGLTFQGFTFRINILTDNEQSPVAQLQIQNVDRRIGAALQSVTNPASLKLELIAGSEFNQTGDIRAERGTAARTYVADELQLLAVEVDAIHITGELRVRDYSTEIWPGIMATQDRFPGLFR